MLVREPPRSVAGGEWPRRVLMTTDAVGGVWQYSLDLAAGLRARGVDVRLAVLGPSPSGAQAAQAARAGVPMETCDCRLEWMDEAWEDVARAGRWLQRLADAYAPDVLHLNGFAHAALPWPVPTVVVAHSCVCSWWRAVHGTPAPAACDEYRRRVTAGLRAAGLIVAPSHAMRDALAVEYGPLPEVRVIANCRGGAAAAAPGGKEPIVFSAGRLWDAAKGGPELCEAAASLAWPVYLAGDASGHGAGRLHGTVRHLGRLSPEDVRAWMARAAIYALPARYEPFGLSILEAAHAGCALVLGDIASLRENWDGAAVFVPPGDAHTLALAIQALIDDQDARLALADRARARSADFAAGRTITAYCDSYRAAAARQATALAGS